MKLNYYAIGCLLALNACSTDDVPAVSVDIDINNKLAEVQPTMWGIFFEDINFAADGGIYAELVKNRSFEFDDPTMGWKIEKSCDADFFAIINNPAENQNNPRYAQLVLNGVESTITLQNEGFRGMGLKESHDYYFSALIRNVSGNPIKAVVTLNDENGSDVGQTEAQLPCENCWQKIEAVIKSDKTTSSGSMSLKISGEGELNIDMISLFPADTWQGRKGGLRADLVQLLADMKPGFLRFPGGCIVEGRDLSVRYQWKKTVGPVENRKMIVNRWNTEFAHRLTPDYYQTFGLGFYEYFQLAEDIGAEPLPILSCGIACQYNTGELVPVSQLDEYIQDAIDLVEFANGGVDTKWGKVRASMGHPEPFGLKMLGVGNEQWGSQYFERYALFEKALREKCPDIKIVSGSGPSAEGEFFDYAWNELKTKYDADIVDEHYYKNPDWFLQNATRYDNYDRKGPKVFAGEYAAQSIGIASPDNKNYWQCAIAEAAFMTGLERNADVVCLASYAPLFGHLQGWQWTPNMIWFDNLKSYGTANYQVQKLFSLNKGNIVVSTQIGGKNVVGDNGLYASSVVDTVENVLIIKIVNVADKSASLKLNIKGANIDGNSVELTTLHADNGSALNTIDNPSCILPQTSNHTITASDAVIGVGPSSVSVVKIKLQK